MKITQCLNCHLVAFLCVVGSFPGFVRSQETGPESFESLGFRDCPVIARSQYPISDAVAKQVVLRSEEQCRSTLGDSGWTAVKEAFRDHKIDFSTRMFVVVTEPNAKMGVIVEPMQFVLTSKTKTLVDLNIYWHTPSKEPGVSPGEVLLLHCFDGEIKFVRRKNRFIQELKLP